IEPERFAAGAPEEGGGRPAGDGGGSESSMNAWRDPIHHLRLFANYLTPRRGLLSYDTWRAVSVITRNLTLTWLVLLPVLTAVMLFGQLFFLVAPSTRDDFLTKPPQAQAHRNTGEVFANRLKLIAMPVAGIAGLIGVLWIAWLLCLNDRSSLSDAALQIVCLLAVLMIAVVVGIERIHLDALTAEIPEWALGAWLAAAGGLFAYALSWPVKVGQAPGMDDPWVRKQWARSLRRNKISRIHTKLMVWMAVTAVVLLLAGFGHEFLIYILPDAVAAPATPGEPGASPSLLTKFSGLLPLLGAVGGSIFTALKAAPSADEKAQRRESSFITRAVFAVTPGLVVIVLAVTVTWLAHQALVHFNSGGHDQMLPKVCTSAGILLSFALAVYEMKWEEKIRPSWSLLFFAGLLATSTLWLANTLFPLLFTNKWQGALAVAFGAAVACGAVVVLIVLQRFNVLGLARRFADGDWARAEAIRRNVRRIAVALPVAGLLAAVFLAYRMAGEVRSGGDERDRFEALASLMPVALTALTASIILFRLLVVRKRNGRQRFELKAFRDTALGRSRQALAVVGLACLLLPVAVVCWLHVAIVHEHKAPASLYVLSQDGRAELALMPLLLAALAGGIILFHAVAARDKASRPEKYSTAQQFIAGLFNNHLSRFRLTGRLLELAGEHRGKVTLAAVGASVLLAGLAGRALSAQQAAAGAQPAAFIQGLAVSGNLIYVALLLCASLVLLRMSVVTPTECAAPAGAAGLAGAWRRRARDHSRGLAWLLAAGCIIVALFIGYTADASLAHAVTAKTKEAAGVSASADTSAPLILRAGVIAGMVACFILAVFEMKWGKGDNRRSLWLLACAYATLTTLFLVNSYDIAQFFGDPKTLVVLRSAFGLIVAVMVWVVALGWMVDPNGVSMHHFYKGRLVRAYLGASNINRREQHKEIAELAADDDPYLADLKNCQRGAPYHIVNTTLNLVAGRDLATAQRSASSFVLSKRHCGSLRTNYRPTAKYMRGQLTLGTAIAASGAAVSPNMGSKKPTAALAMLLTLLNVRLGYWAPTPSRENWQMSQPRLWPFYLLREFLSQTNDVSSYCYLTDGGHFDNTGLYSLVERGCRHIVLVDCGADPQPSCFQDLGEAIRRCRIDFGTEVKLDLGTFIKTEGERPRQYFAVGGIRYSRKHAEALGWPLEHEEGSKEDKASRTGYIVYIKPSIIGSETADVRQYAIENEDFPQQTTANQWFDEAQFESYRRLGQICAKAAFGKLKSVEKLKRSTRLSPALIDEMFAEVNLKFNACHQA
ncbi:MAG TPA: hypothetical protein VD968_19885, partial [Pyrinomonadaceae bacterium]|nr:hypothetical protein [Pyrinomonadaceae bacterium]